MRRRRKRGSKKNRLRERRTRGRRKKKEEEDYKGRKTKVFFRVNCFFFDTHSRSLVLKTLAYSHR